MARHVQQVYPYTSISNKRQKLCNDLYEFIPPDNIIHREIWECFNAYEYEISKHVYEKNDFKRKNVFSNKTLEFLRKELAKRNNACQNMTGQLHFLTEINNNLREELDTLNVRLVQNECDREVDIRHYKNVIIGLQAELSNTTLCADYMMEFKKLILHYENRETLENVKNFCTERTCCVCLTEKANMVCKPCSHLEFCFECAQKISNQSLNTSGCKILTCGEYTECPRCKQELNSIEFIYI